MLPKNVKSVFDAQNLASYQVFNGIPQLESKNLQSWSKEMYDAYSTAYAETKKGMEFLDSIEGITISPKMLTISQIKELLTTVESIDIGNKIDTIEAIAVREFETMTTLATIAYDLEAFKKLNVSTIGNYHGKALMLIIDTKNYTGHIVIVCNGMDLYEVYSVDATESVFQFECMDFMQFNTQLINHFTN